jgi:hypothetical protein
MVYATEGSRWLPDLAKHVVKYTVDDPRESTAITVERLLSIDQKTFGVDSLNSPSYWGSSLESARRRPAVDPAELALMPLTELERYVLAEMDTTNRIAQAPIGAGRSAVQRPSGPLTSAARFANLLFARATGLGIGFHYPLLLSAPEFEFEPSLTYGFADHRMNWILRLSRYAGEKRSSVWSASAFETIRLTPRQGRFSAAGMIGDVLFGEPNADVYRVQGWNIGHEYRGDRARWSVTFSNEEHGVAPEATSFSLFKRSSVLRPPLPVSEGRWQELRGEVNSPSLCMSAVVAARRLTDPEGRYVQILLISSDSIGTITDRLAVPPVLVWRLTLAGSSWGTPSQSYASPETRIWQFAGPNVFHGMRPMEFSGDRMAALALEHNFRGLPFLVLGLGGLYRYGLEFLIHGGFVSIAQTNADRRIGGRNWRTTSGWYTEAGVSIAGLLKVFRLDVTRRFRNGRNTVVTFGTSINVPSLQEVIGR